MKINFKSLLVKSIFLTLPLSYMTAAQADADRLAGVIYNFKYTPQQGGPTYVNGDIQIGILYEGQASSGSNNVMSTIVSKGQGILKGMGISGAFYTDVAEYAGKGECDNVYNHITGRSQNAAAKNSPWGQRSNSAVIKFSQLPKPPTSLTDPAAVRSWVAGIAGSISIAQAQDNPCNWSGRGDLNLFIKVPTAMMNDVLADKGLPGLRVAPNDLTKYTIIAFKLANVESPIPW